MNRLLTFAILTVCFTTAFAATRVPGLYTVELQVESQGSGARGEALKKGLVEVLTRVSGKSGLEQNNKISEAGNNASVYVFRYRYVSKTVKGESRQFIRIRYNPTMINKLLAHADLPIWTDRRPSTLMWIAVDDGRRRFVVGADSQHDVRYAAERNATRRGIPVVLPLLDLEDRQKIKYVDIAGGFFGAIKRASARYSADAILVGKVQRYGNQWRARWTLLIKDQTFTWSSSGADAHGALATGVDALANNLASNADDSSPVVRYEDDPNQKIQVTNISKFTDYVNLVNYLEKNKHVKSLQVISLTGSRVLVSVELGSDLNSFKQSVSDDGKLRVDDGKAVMVKPEKSPANGAGKEGGAAGDNDKDQADEPMVREDRSSTTAQSGTSANNNLPAGTLRYRYIP